MTQDAHHMPVTVVVSRRPKPGKEAALVAWAEGISEAASHFPGHLGRTIYPPSAPDREDLVMVFSFDNADALTAWETSDIRRAWLAQADAIAEGQQHFHSLTGFESIFSPSVGATKSPPPRWKTGAVIALALFPLSLVLNWFVMPYLPVVSDNTYVMALIRVIVSVAIIVPYMVYFAMPGLTKRLRGWLHP